MSRDWRLSIGDMLEAATRIVRYTEGLGLDALLADEMRYDAVLRNLEILGEAAKNVPGIVRNQYPRVEWRKLAGLRDVLAHGYFRVEDETIWDIVQSKVPPLVDELQNVDTAESPGGAG